MLELSTHIEDPYPHCEDGKCHHDTREGVLVVDLLERDGPYRPTGVPGLLTAIAHALHRKQVA